MNRGIFPIALLAFVAALGPARADDDDDDDEGGKGWWGGPPPWAGRDDDAREFYKKRAERQREYWKKLEERRREGDKGFEEWLREDDKRRREAEREYDEDLREDGRRFHVRTGYPVRGEYGRGYRGYFPDGPASYPPRVYGPPRYDDPYPVYGVDDPVWHPGDYPPVAPVPPERVPRFVEPPPPPPVGAIDLVGEADVLVEQSDAFLQTFSQSGWRVPERDRFLRDAQALNESALYFRGLLTADSDPGQLAAAFRAVADWWGRLSWRTERIAQGRTGPNIEQVRLMGQTIERIRQAFPY